MIQQAEEFQRAFDRQTVAEAKQQKSEQQKSETTAKVPFVTVSIIVNHFTAIAQNCVFDVCDVYFAEISSWVGRVGNDRFSE